MKNFMDYLMANNPQMILIVVVILLFITLSFLIFFSIKSTKEDRKERKRFSKIMKSGDKCKFYIDGEFEGEVIEKLNDDRVVVSIELPKDSLYSLDYENYKMSLFKKKKVK